VIDKDAAATGVREFIEESGHMLASLVEDLNDEMHNPSQTRVFWYPAGKYALFLYHIPSPHAGTATTTPYLTALTSLTGPATESLIGLPERYNKLEETFEMEKLYWIPLPSLLEAFNTNDRQTTVQTHDGQTLQVLR